MEHLDYSQILEKIGPEKDMSRLTEEEWLFYDMVRAVKSRSADDERQAIQMAIRQFSRQYGVQMNTNENRINMKTSNKTWIGIAAGVAVLVVAYFFLWSPSQSADEIFSKNFKPMTAYISVAKDKATQYGMAGGGAEGRDSFLRALALYEKSRYEEAIKIFAPLVENYPDDNDSRFYLSFYTFTVYYQS